MVVKNSWNAVRRKLENINFWAGRELCSDGEIAARLGLSPEEFYGMELEHTELTVALTDARKPLIRIADESLKKLISGYEYKEKTITFSTDKNGKPVRAESIRVTSKTIPPQVGAIDIYLKRFDPYYRCREMEDAKLNIRERSTRVKENSENRKNRMDRLRFLKS